MEVGPDGPKDTTVPPVSETAPKIDEPIDTKPIDTAAVTAPVDTAIDGKAEETTAVPAAAEETTSPRTEKKSFLAGFMKKHDGKKEETKEEKRHETPAAETTTPATTDAAEPTNEHVGAKEERPAREKRRTSLFGGLGTIKKNKKDESETSEAKENPSDVKREKSPLPSKIGGLFRKPSKAVKSEEAHDTKAVAPAETVTESTPATTETAPATDVIGAATTTDEAKPTTTVPEPTDSKIVGDVVPEELHATTHDQVTTAPEIKATA